MRQWIGSALVQRLIVGWILRNNFKWTFNRFFFHSRKCIWKHRLWNCGHCKHDRHIPSIIHEGWFIGSLGYNMMFKLACIDRTVANLCFIRCYTLCYPSVCFTSLKWITLWSLVCGKSDKISLSHHSNWQAILDSANTVQGTNSTIARCF